MLKIVDVILEVIDLVRPLVELIGRHDRVHATLYKCAHPRR